MVSFFFFNDTATTEIYTLSLTRRSSDLGVHSEDKADAHGDAHGEHNGPERNGRGQSGHRKIDKQTDPAAKQHADDTDRKSTRLNSSHSQISYAVFCLTKRTAQDTPTRLG